MNARKGRVYFRQGTIEAAKPKNYGPTVTQHKLDMHLMRTYKITLGKDGHKINVDLSVEKIIVLSNQRPYCACCHTVVPFATIKQHCAAAKHRQKSDDMHAHSVKCAEENEGVKVQARMQSENIQGSTTNPAELEANMHLLRAFAAGNVPVNAIENMKAST